MEKALLNVLALTLGALCILAGLEAKNPLTVVVGILVAFLVRTIPDPCPNR